MQETTITRRSFLKSAAIITAAVGGACAIDEHFVEVNPALAAETNEDQILCTSCRACISNCAIKAHVRNGRVVRLEGDPFDPMSNGRVCAKGMSGIQALYNPNRMKYPMKRVGERGNNDWERISWEEAIDTIADALMELSEKGDSLQLVTSTGGGGNPQFYSPIRFAGVFEGNFFEPGCAQCFLPRNHAQPAINGTTHNSIADSGGTEVYLEDNEMKSIVFWGSGPSQSCPGSGGHAVSLLRENGVKTVVIDPRFTPDASKAEVWLPIRPGTDVAMLLCWIKYLLENKHYDEEFCLHWTNLPFLINEETMLTYRASELGIGSEDEYVVWDQKTGSPKPMPFPWNDELDPALDGEFQVNGEKSRTGFRALKEAAQDWTIAKAADTCCCEADSIEAAIKIFIEGSPNAGVNLGVATDQYPQSAQCAMGATILDIIMGNIQNPGNLTQARPEIAPGTYMWLNFGFFGPHPLAMSQEKIASRLGFIEHKGLGYWHSSHIPTIREALSTGKPYQPKIWLDRSGNKPVMLGGANQFLEAAKNFELIVHMYMYPTTMSTEMADIILPTAEWLETAYAAERMNVMLIRQDITHLYEAVDETMIWSWLAFAMAKRGHERFKMACDPATATVDGQPLAPYYETYDEYKDFLAGFVSAAWDDGRTMTWEEFQSIAPAEYMPRDTWRTKWYQNYKQINEETGLPNGVNTASKKCEPYADCMTVMGRTGAVLGKDGLGYSYPPASVDYPPLPYYVEPDESPLTDTEYPYTLTEGRLPMFHHGTLRNVPYIREIYPVALTWINPETAEDIGVEDGDWVKLTSRRGETHGKALVTEGIAPKVVYQERFWNPELLDSEDPKQAWQAMNINVLTSGDAPFNPEYGTYTLRGFQVKIEKSEKPAGVWENPEDFESWMPQPSDDTGGGYAVYGA